MTIRTGTPEDAGAIARIQREASRAASHGMVPERVLERQDLSGRAAGWRGALARGDWPVLVLDLDGRVAGGCRLGPPRDPNLDRLRTAEILSIFLAPEVWRKGHGRALCRRALEEAAGRGRSEVVLWVLEANRGGCRFCEALGFRADGGVRVEGETGQREVRYRIALTGAAAKATTAGSEPEAEDAGAAAESPGAS